MNRPPDGVLLVDKPAGMTSHAVVARVGRLLGVYPARRGRRFRIGHAGTLDPAATGLLVLLLGRATRLSAILLGHRKTYLARVVLGRETDTLDAEGETVRTAALPSATVDLAAALAAFRGEQWQTPPVYSSLKRDGVSLHRLARAGREPAAPAQRRIVVHDLLLVDREVNAAGELASLALRLRCSGGTYVRALARDLGRRLGTAAHLGELRREEVGELSVQAAVPLGELLDREAILARMCPAASALPEWPRLLLDEAAAASVAQGVQPQPAWLERLPRAPLPLAGGNGGFLMETADGTLLAVCHVPLDVAGRPAGPPRLQIVLGGLQPPAADKEQG